jgi:hypothetical protein
MVERSVRSAFDRESLLSFRDQTKTFVEVIGWVTKIYYLELLRASEGTLSRWSRLHLQS